MSNRELRRDIRRQRRELSAKAQRSAAVDLTHHLITDLTFLKARRMAFYMADGGEMDPALLLMTAYALGKTCHLPVICDQLMRFRRAPLAFLQFEPDVEPLALNRFGILEPQFDPRRITKPEVLDIVFMPLVAFDRNGNRLGQGAGYYDRTLADLHRRFRRPKLIGLAYGFQESDTIETNTWDIPLDAIATEREIIPVR